MAMPWKRSKQIADALRGKSEGRGYDIPFPEGYTGSRTIAELNRLFDACFRIQREACEAAGRYIPMARTALCWRRFGGFRRRCRRERINRRCAACATSQDKNRMR